MSLSKVLNKISENTQNSSEFYDSAKPFGKFKKLDITVIPCLEEIDFYAGHKSSEYEYVPETSQNQRYLEKQRSNKVRATVELDNVLNNFEKGHISFIGPAGIGKTTLLNLICRNVLGRKYSGLKDVVIIHYIHCKGFDPTKPIQPGEFLFGNSNPELENSEINIVMRFAKLNPEKVIFVLDSLDTLRFMVDGVYETIDLYEAAYPEVIIANLFFGTLIPGCRIITSSREHAIRNYRGNIRPDKIIAIVGLSRNSINEIVKGYIGRIEAKKFMEYLENKSISLLTLCSTPVITVYTLVALKTNPDFEPTTMSGIMILVLQSILRSPHTRQENILEILNKLKELSYFATMNRRVIFTHEDLLKFNLKPEETTDLAILIPGGISQKLLQGIDILYFSHQSLQEMLAALWILQADVESFNVFVENFLFDPHFAVVFKMICGLLFDDKVQKAACGIWEADDENLRKMREVIEKRFRSKLLAQSDNADFLQLIISLNEAQNGLSELIDSCLNVIALYGLSLSTSDIHAIGSVISRCKMFLNLTLCDCNVKPDVLEVLFSTMKGSQVKLQQLYLPSNANMQLQSTKTIGGLCNGFGIKELDFRRCHFTAEQLRLLKSSLDKGKLRGIALSESRIAEHEIVSAVAEILSNITQRVWLRGWKMEIGERRLLQNQLNNIRAEELKISTDYGDLQSEHLLGNTSTTPIQDEVQNSSTIRSVIDVKYKDTTSQEKEARRHAIATAWRHGREKTYRSSERNSLWNKNVAIEVTPSGRSLKFDVGKVHFPENAVTVSTIFNLSFTHQPELWPEEYVGISRMLTVLPSTKFLVPVTIHTSHWCTTTSNDVIAYVMTKTDDKYEIIQQISLKDSETEIIFDCQHFSRFWTFIKSIFLGDVEYSVISTLFYDEEANFILVIHVDDEVYRSNLIEKMAGEGFSKAHIYPDPNKLYIGDEVQFALRCRSHDEYIFETTDNPIFKMDCDFAKNPEKMIRFSLTHLPGLNQLLRFSQVETRDNKELQYIFNLKWRWGDAVEQKQNIKREAADETPRDTLINVPKGAKLGKLSFEGSSIFYGCTFKNEQQNQKQSNSAIESGEEQNLSIEDQPSTSRTEEEQVD